MPMRDAGWRPDLYVLARFLDRLREPDAAYSRSQLQAATRVNYDVFRRYLDFLVERGLVVVHETPEGGSLVRLTPEGWSAHERMSAWIVSVLGERAF